MFLQVQDLVGLARGLEQREARAATDVGAEPAADARRPHSAEAKQAAAEEQVRRRAKCRGPALRCHGRTVLIVHMQAMGEHRPFAH